MATPKKGKTKTKKVKSPFLKGQPAWFSNRVVLQLFLFFLGMGVYFNTYWNDFAQDDAIVITENEFTKQGIDGIDELFAYDTFRGFFKVEGKANLVQGGRYRPLTPAMFALGVEFFGENPVIGHVTNSLLAGLTAVLIFLLFLRLLAPANPTTYAIWVALVTAVLFAVHPIHTEAVANIKGRDEIMALLGSLAAVYWAVLAYDRRKPIWLLPAFLAFFLALLSKENAITFVIIAPLTLYFFRPLNLTNGLKTSLPFLLAAVLFLAIRFSILGVGVGEASGELMNNPFLKLEGNRYVPFTTGEWLATVLFGLGKYLQLLIFPHPLTHDYYPRQIGVMQFSDWRVLLSLLAYVAMAIWAFIKLLKKEILSYAILFYLGTIFIVSNIPVNIGTHISERFLYMPSLGFCLAIAVLSYRLAKQLNGGKLSSFGQLRGIGIVLVVIGLLLGIKTMSRNTVWKDNYTLFTTDIQVSSNSAKLNNSAGGETIARSLEVSDPQRKKQLLQQAVGYLKQAIRIHPNYKNAYLLLGNAHNYLEEYDASIQYYRQALVIDPNYAEAQGNLALTYRDAGRFYGEQKGDLRAAEKYLLEAYKALPNDYETARLLGVVYGNLGQSNQAVNFFTKALELAEDSVKADAYFNLGIAYYNTGDPLKGAENHQKAAELDPEILKRLQQQ
jgi:tetratricopeptide (TPR) repeat protein